MSACVQLLNWRSLIPAAEMVSPLANMAEFDLGKRSVRVLAAVMRDAHPFEVVLQAKVASVVRKGGITPAHLCLVYCCSDPEPWTNLHLRGGVGVLLRILASPAILCVGSWGGACRRRVF